MKPLVVERVTEPAQLARLETPWRRHVAAAGLPGPFCDFTWQFEWWRALGGGPRRLRGYVARRGGDVVGILPAFEERHHDARFLALLGSRGGGGDYLDLPAQDPSVAQALVEAALEDGADVLELDDVEWTSPLRTAALQAAEEFGARAVEEPRFPCPFVPLRPGFASLLARSGRKENLRRRRKWLEAQPGYRIVCENDEEAVAPFLERFHRLHAARWAADGGSQAFPDPRLRRFHERVSQRFAEEGRLRLWTMWVASEAVAVAWTFDDGDRSLYYQSGFLPAWGAKSVGLVLFAAYLEDACARGMREVDLLRGSEPYKFEWTKEGRRTVSVRIVGSGRGARAMALRASKQAARRLAMRALPQTVRRSASRIVREARMRGA